MTKHDPQAVAVAGEIADALATHAAMPCQPTIDDEDGLWTLTVRFRPPTVDDALSMLDLAERLRRVQDVAQVRGFAARYGIDAERLEGVIASAIDRPDDGARLTLYELTAIVGALEDLCDREDQDVIATALPKLRAQLAGEIF